MSHEQTSLPDGSVFLLRVDCEHPEAIRWGGGEATEVIGLERLLVLLDRLAVPATFAFVGATAARFPELARACVARGHAVAGHSMHHAGRYAGQPEELQRADMLEMIAAIQEACGVHVDGLAAPDHGAIDEATLRAAMSAGLDYVLNLSILAANGKALGPAPKGPAGIYVPSAHLQFLWDWTDLWPGMAPFSAVQARDRWQAAIQNAAEINGAVSLIIHPWIVEVNNEYELLAAVLQQVRRVGGSFVTFSQALAASAA